MNCFGSNVLVYQVFGGKDEARREASFLHLMVLFFKVLLNHYPLDFLKLFVTWPLWMRGVELIIIIKKRNRKLVKFWKFGKKN